MNLNSLTFKLPAFIMAVFILVIVGVFVLANQQLKQLLHGSKESEYAERVDTIYGILSRDNERLEKTGLVSGSIDDFQQSSLKFLQANYYKQSDQAIYPFILDAEGGVILHPVLHKGDLSLGEKREALSKKTPSVQGSSHFCYQDNRNWFIYKRFEAWNWEIGYSVPLRIMYADARDFRKTLLIILGGAAVLLLLLSCLAVRRSIKPITGLTETATQIASGLLDQSVNLSSADEISILSRSFDNMRTAIQNQIAELNREIGERKLVEQALKQSEQRLDLALSGANEGIWEWRIDHDAVYFDSRYYTMAGYSPNEFPSTFEEWEKRVHKDDIEGVKTVIAQYLANDLDRYQVEFRFLHKSGDYMWIQGKGRIVERDDQGNPTRFIGTHFDITARKEAEEALRITQFSFDKSAIGIYEIGSDGRILNVNEHAAQMLGYTIEELCTKYTFDIDPFLSDEKKAALWERLAEVGWHIFETTHQKKDGSLVPVEITSNLLEYEGRLYSIAFVQDITERKAMEQDLRESEERFRTLHNASFGGLFIHENGIILECNQGLSKITGYARDELIGMNRISTLIVPEYREDVVQYIRSNSEEPYEAKGVKKDGTIYPLYIQGKIIPYKGRTVRAVEYRDITELKQAEEELRRLRNYLSNIINSMPSVLVGVDREGRVTQWNKQAEHVTGLLSDQVVTKPLGSVFARLTDQMASIKTAIQERRVITTPKLARKERQETRYEDVTIFPLVVDGAEGAVIQVDDVTERVRLEELMIQSEKMLSVGGLAAGMAHEINNPLAGILQNAALLHNRLLADIPANQRAADTAGFSLPALWQYLELRKLPEMIDNIRGSGMRAATIVKNMLGFARKSDRTVSRHDMCALIDRTIELIETDYDMKKKYDFKKIRIERVYDEADTLMPCEAGKIQQVILNILKNGAEAMAGLGAKGGEVPAQRAPMFIIRVKGDGDWVHVEIEDNGPGMDTKTRRSVFEPFFTTKPVGKGTGLGLSVSYFIVTEDHGGEMDVRASRSGGTCFVIRLPKVGTD
jgi:PAS domain S-box-containing protein